MKKYIRILFLFAAIICGLAGCHRDAFPLKLGLKKGKQYRYTMTTEQTVSESMLGQKINIKQTIEFVYLFDIQNTDASGDQTIKVTYEKIKFDQENGMMPLHFDSENPDSAAFENPLTGVFSVLKGATFTMVTTADGTVKSVIGMEKMVDDMLSKVTGTLGSEGTEFDEMKAKFKEEYNNESIGKQIETSLKIFPTKPVSVGDSWKIKSAMSSASMPFESELEYTLVERNEKMAKLTLKGDVKSGAGGAIPGINISLDGTMEGKIEVDLETGLTISSVTTQNIKGVTEAMGMKMPMDILSTISVKAEEVK